MYEIFQICFLAGLILIAIAFVIGQFCDLTGINGLDLSIGDLPILVPFSPLLLFLFMTIFGGVGMLLLKKIKYAPLVLPIGIAAGIGLIVCIAIQRAIIVPLKKAENTSAAAEEELPGLLAKVSEKIPKQGFGEITYIIHGNTYMAPAREISGEEVPFGTEVSICWIKDHVFYVVPIDKTLE